MNGFHSAYESVSASSRQTASGPASISIVWLMVRGDKTRG
jgi:hypothetical protein